MPSFICDSCGSPVWFDAINEPMTGGTVNVTDTDILDSSYEAIQFVEGTITGVNVLRSLETQLDRNAIYALKQWRFEPGKVKGRAVPVRLVIEVNFNLK